MISLMPVFSYLLQISLVLFSKYYSYIIFRKLLFFKNIALWPCLILLKVLLYNSSIISQFYPIKLGTFICKLNIISQLFLIQLNIFMSSTSSITSQPYLIQFGILYIQLYGLAQFSQKYSCLARSTHIYITLVSFYHPA